MGIADKFIQELEGEEEVRALSLSHKEFREGDGKYLVLKSEPNLIEADNRTAISHGDYEGKTFEYLFADERGNYWALYSPSFKLLRTLDKEIKLHEPFRLKVVQVDREERQYIITKI